MKTTTDVLSQALRKNAKARRPRYAEPRSCREARGISARSRTGDPMIGEFGDAKLIKTFGNVPDDVIHNC